MKKKTFSLITPLVLAAGIGWANEGTPTIDGTKDASGPYIPVLTSQTVQTNFGNASGALLAGGGSELDALYAAHDTNNLYLMVTGNLEANGNTLVILIDSVPDTNGVSQLPNIAGTKDGVWGAGAVGEATLPAGFNADLGLVYKGFDNGTNGTGNYDFVLIDADFSAATSNFTDPDVLTSTTDNPLPVQTIVLGSITYNLAFDNSNSAGVNGGTAAAVNDPLAVDTGFEIAIPLSALSLAANDQVNIMCFVSNGNASFASNQFLPPLPAPQDNLGGPPSGGYDFSSSGVGLSFATYTLQDVLSVNDWSLYN